MHKHLIKQNSEANQEAWQYLTVQQFVQHNPAFTLGGIRSQIFYEKTNGLRACGAIIRNGRRILINETKYFQWLEAKNQGVDPGERQ